MAQLRQDYPEFVKRDAEVIAIGPEKEKTFTNWWQKHQMPFTGIADPEHRVANVYGQEVKALRLGRMPELVVIEKKGYMRFKHQGKAMSDIPGNEEVLALLDELNKEAEASKK